MGSGNDCRYAIVLIIVPGAGYFEFPDPVFLLHIKVKLISYAFRPILHPYPRSGQLSSAAGASFLAVPLLALLMRAGAPAKIAVEVERLIPLSYGQYAPCPNQERPTSLFVVVVGRTACVCVCVLSVCVCVCLCVCMCLMSCYFFFFCDRVGRAKGQSVSAAQLLQHVMQVANNRAPCWNPVICLDIDFTHLRTLFGILPTH